jgi:hypothetical protein
MDPPPCCRFPALLRAPVDPSGGSRILSPGASSTRSCIGRLRISHGHALWVPSSRCTYALHHLCAESVSTRTAGAGPYAPGALGLNSLTRSLQNPPATTSRMSVLQGAQVQWDT